jgi:DNA-binding response OmpR family regulator
VNEPLAVLAVASNRRNLELLTETLEHDGYPVEAVADLAAGRELLDSGLGVAVVDVDGFSRAVLTLVEELHGRGTPVVVLSRRVSSVLRQQAMDAGALAVLEKPVTRAELTDRLQVLAPTPN